ncbi:protein translocase subunit SecD [Oharaeibacter diazotrophicus]|uniref:Protein translocase subunit SecD n=1 Tax=Oharaeibacter diazotrophicus TaxID=1920512 RepID=A0A4R6RLZ0_9HYPH|nr:protein translocase subunit SecD [Oharaeibacter diazotrophicus]TDP86997.1 preprotein translocase subunit SecD [Oharaeibacter diazotrophicus]BBE71060.1 preprotein translocase subunit SecD [Pleomorphomonas sp. SM30]GLS77811.1 protein translocase subunit SecD [Oharaeibacter diazotrophicus]
MLYFSRWKVTAILLTIVVGLLVLVPNFLTADQLQKNWPNWLPGRQIVLGLDLQGGVYLLYEVDTADYQAKRLKGLENDVRIAMRQDPRIGYTGLTVSNGAVQLRVRDADKFAEAKKRLDGLVNPLSNALLGGTAVSEFQVEDAGEGLYRMSFTEEGLSQRLGKVVDQSIEVIRRRVDELGTTEPSIQRQSISRILVEAPGEKDPARLKDIIGRTAQLTFHLVDVNANLEDAVKGVLPPGTMLLNSRDTPPRPYVVEEAPLLTGEDLTDAQEAFQSQTNEPVVSFRLSTGGSRKFAQVTTENVNRPFAIVLDDEVISAPVIREPITQGSGQISGNFTVESANDLAVLLRAGALPARLGVVEERTVGPGLGADSIAAGQRAAVIGVVGVVVFMLASYGLFGLFANVALMVNIVLIFAVLTLLQATLTLPGIAGIVLTMGMAVDSNVLIYERIREEQRLGRSAITAIDTGFQRAFGTIVDANITTLIAAGVLFQLGSGPVRGFAVTLTVGILTTMFTAITFTRLVIAVWVRRTRPTAVPL